MHQSPRSPETGPARRARTSPAKESATAVKTFGGRSSASRPAAGDRFAGVTVAREGDRIPARRRGARLRSGGGQGLLPARRQGGSELDPPEPSPTRAVPGPEAVLAADDHELPPSIRRRHPEQHRRAVEVEVPAVMGMDLVGPAQAPARRVEGDE